MTRRHKRESNDPGVLNRTVAEGVPAIVLSIRSSLALVAGLLTCLLLATPATAQNTDVEDVHVAPRGDSGKPAPVTPEGTLEDMMRAHAPLLKSKVDLVLVPVTVTDPMNRLVTGLDKENFAIFEGKDRQEVR